MNRLAGNIPLITLVSCPGCLSDLKWDTSMIHCPGCAHSFPIIDGVPVMLMDPKGDDDVTRKGRAHKLGQVSYYDRAVSAEFEVSRPHGTPQLYEWLISQKLQRSVQGIQALVPGWTALTVCGGSGMDAEFLARIGCRVISSDISLGAARRAKERALRYGFQLLPIVAEAENLPFKDRSLDLVYVHDGLHHLSDPKRGLEEMARVAERAVSITEPARAAATAVAIHLRLADEVEDAGNRVARLNAHEASSALRALGFMVLKSQRYAMYYPHEPGPGFLKLSRPVLFSMVKACWQVVNAVLGPRIGNKLSIVALREGKPHLAVADSSSARQLLRKASRK
jgi:SAM-dependent methyltransferase